MRVIHWLHAIALGAIVCVSPLSAQSAPDSRAVASQPNVLIFYSDDQNYAALGIASQGVVKTPNLDRLAREGARFTRFAANHPVCTPSRATLQSGLYAPIHGAFINNLLMDPPHTTYLAEVFSRAGYSTGYAGKWHIDGGLNDHGVPTLLFRPRGQSYVDPGERRRGYQEYLGYECCPISNEPFYWSEGIDFPHFTPVPEYGWEPAFQRAVLREFVQRHAAANEPWMYQISFAAPHVPLMAPQEFLDLYDPETLPLPPWMPKNLTPEQAAYARGILRPYYAMCSHMDAEIGNMLADLEAAGQANNTIIVFASDNGDFLGAHWDDLFHFDPNQFQGKGLPISNAFRVPLIMRWPGHIPSGIEVSALTGTIDLAPTILGLASLPIPWRMQGLDMSPWALGAEGPHRRALWISLVRINQPSFAAVWDGDYILSGWDIPLLYDLTRDPNETTNVLNQPGYAETQSRLERSLQHLTLEAYNPPSLPDISPAADEAALLADDVAPRQGGAAAMVDGMPVRAHIALARAVGRGQGGDEVLSHALLSAFAQNLEAFDVYDLRRLRKHRALVTVALSSSTALRDYVVQRLSERFGVALTGTYRPAFCETAGACFPSDPYLQPPARDAARNFEEPLAGSGDADMDGVSNAQEYANAMAAGKSLDDFVRAALDPTLNGSEPVPAPVGG